MNTKNNNFQYLIEQLNNEDGFEREKARIELAKLGDEVIPKLMILTNDSEHRMRWESMKALTQMEKESLIPFFIEKLKCDESDIRWMAAEGLSKLGKSVIGPLLDAVLKDTDSVFLLSGAHHIIHHLMIRKQLPNGISGEQLLPLLKEIGMVEKLKTEVFGILKEIR